LSGIALLLIGVLSACSHDEIQAPGRRYVKRLPIKSDEDCSRWRMFVIYCWLSWAMLHTRREQDAAVSRDPGININTGAMDMNSQWLESPVVRALLCAVIALGAPCVEADESAVPAAGSVSTEESSFVVFDATLYKHKPDLSRNGLQPINVICGHCFYPGKKVQDGLPSEQRVQTAARKAALTGQPAVLNIEFWPLKGSEEEIAESLYRFEMVASWFHAAAPGVSMGFYGRPPVADYSRAIIGPGTSDPAYEEWRSENERLLEMARYIDAVYPSVYTFYEDRDGWVKYAVANISESRRYGKPVYAFLWPQYHPAEPELAWKFLPADYWRLQLETARQHADGIVIWGGWQDPGVRLNWDDSAPWWLETQDFLADHGLTPSP
jgi:hypothetical protein